MTPILFPFNAFMNDLTVMILAHGSIESTLKSIKSILVMTVCFGCYTCFLTPVHTVTVRDSISVSILNKPYLIYSASQRDSYAF